MNRPINIIMSSMYFRIKRRKEKWYIVEDGKFGAIVRSFLTEKDATMFAMIHELRVLPHGSLAPKYSKAKKVLKKTTIINYKGD